MYTVLLVGPDKGAWGGLAEALTDQGLTVEWAADGAEAIESVRQGQFHLAVINDQLGDMTGLDLIPQLLMVNAMVNTALVSSMSSHDFHETTEGLGVLAQLPPNPGPGEAAELVADLKRIIP